MRFRLLLWHTATLGLLLALAAPAWAVSIGRFAVESREDDSITLRVTIDNEFDVVDGGSRGRFRIRWNQNPIDRGRVSETSSEQPIFTIGRLKPSTTYLINVQAWTKRNRGGFLRLKRYRSVGSIVVSTKAASPDYCPPIQWNGSQVQPRFDGANCFIARIPDGQRPFIYQERYYIESQKRDACPIDRCPCPAGRFDGKNCLLMPKPARGFIWENGFYREPGPGGQCPDLWPFDGANCFWGKAPWGTTAFEYEGSFYTTRRPYCPIGRFDGANCFLGEPPRSRKPFIYRSGFYYE